MVEIREKIKGNYKGYIYCNEIKEAEIIMEDIKNKLLNQKIINFSVAIKHGCSEFYVPHPKFEKVSSNNQEVMNYKEEWMSNGNWACVVSVPGGMKNDIIDKVASRSPDVEVRELD